VFVGVGPLALKTCVQACRGCRASSLASTAEWSTVTLITWTNAWWYHMCTKWYW